jgi:hypothetical protein
MAVTATLQSDAVGATTVVVMLFFLKEYWLTYCST